VNYTNEWIKSKKAKMFVADTKDKVILNDDNTFLIEVDTSNGNKHVLLSTSKTDGEQFKYKIKIDAVSNTIEASDDSGNVILLDSNVPSITATNRSGSFIDINDKNITLKADGDITIDAGGSIIEKAGSSISEEAPSISESASDISSTSSGSNAIVGAPLSLN